MVRFSSKPAVKTAASFTTGYINFIPDCAARYTRSRPLAGSVRTPNLPIRLGSSTPKSGRQERLMILNGPNLNLLGVREPHNIYGTPTLSPDPEQLLSQPTPAGLGLDPHLSPVPTARARAWWIDPVGAADRRRHHHQSGRLHLPSLRIAVILDAIKAFEGPVIEVHISNIHARDELHRHSKISVGRHRRDLRVGALRLHRRDARAGADGEKGVSGLACSTRPD